MASIVAILASIDFSWRGLFVTIRWLLLNSQTHVTTTTGESRSFPQLTETATCRPSRTASRPGATIRLPVPVGVPVLDIHRRECVSRGLL